MNLDFWQVVLFLLLALFAEILGTIGGFGSSVFFIPIASLFLDFQSVLGITALFHVISNVSKIALFKHGFDKFLILYLGIPAVLFVILGAFLSKILNVDYLEIALSIFLIILSLIFLIFSHLKLKATKTNAISGGVLSGFVAGLLGTGGAIRGITLSAFNIPSMIFISTSAVIDLGIDLSRSVVYSTNGFVHMHDLYLIPFLFGISFLGTYLGKKILEKISQERFKQIVLLLILITGITTLVKQLM
ncbi:MAG: sulfite exporter TauE/SafE family protein [Flavobacteriia bacterium]|jgi:uncharacterized membrane protein YfcA